MLTDVPPAQERILMEAEAHTCHCLIWRSLPDSFCAGRYANLMAGTRVSSMREIERRKERRKSANGGRATVRIVSAARPAG